MLFRSLRLLVVGVAMCAAQAAYAEPYFITDSFNFSGSWTGFNSNPLTGPAQAVSSGTMSTADMNMYFNSNLPSFPANHYYQSLVGAPALNFFGVYGINDAVTKTSVTFDPSYQSVTLSEKGATTGTLSRFDAGRNNSLTQGGDWLDYTLSATLLGVNGDPKTMSADNNGSVPIDASGYFHGVFFNSAAGPGEPTYYDVTLQLGNRGAPSPDPSIGTGYYGASNTAGPGFPGSGVNAVGAVIPEPTSCLAFAMVFAASAGYGWRRKRQVSAPVEA